MQLTATPYRLLKKIRDDQFDEDQIGEYNLAMLTGRHDLQVLVYHEASGRALWLEDYVFPSSKNDDDWLAALQEVFDQHAFLTAGYWKHILVGVKTGSFVQTPMNLFEPAFAAQYLHYNTNIQPTEDVLYYQQAESGIATSFTLPSDVRNWLLSVYPLSKPAFTHQSCALIEGILKESSAYPDNPLYIFVDRFKLHILSAEQGKLRYYNQFSIKSFDDYIRYIMLVMHSLGMDQRTGRVILWGFVGKNSPHYQEFYKYIKTVTYGNRPDVLRFGYMFDEIQEHQYFDVINLSRLAKP